MTTAGETDRHTEREGERIFIEEERERERGGRENACESCVEENGGSVAQRGRRTSASRLPKYLSFRQSSSSSSSSATSFLS